MTKLMPKIVISRIWAGRGNRSSRHATSSAMKNRSPISCRAMDGSCWKKKLWTTMKAAAANAYRCRDDPSRQEEQRDRHEGEQGGVDDLEQHQGRDAGRRVKHGGKDGEAQHRSVRVAGMRRSPDALLPGRLQHVVLRRDVPAVHELTAEGERPRERERGTEDEDADRPATGTVGQEEPPDQHRADGRRGRDRQRGAVPVVQQYGARRRGDRQQQRPGEHDTGHQLAPCEARCLGATGRAARELPRRRARSPSPAEAEAAA